MLASTLLFALPLLGEVLAQPHSRGPVVRHHPHLAGPPTEREIAVLYAERHDSRSPSHAEAVEAIASMSKVRRKKENKEKKRSCKAQSPVLVPNSSSTTAIGDNNHAKPTAASSSVAQQASTTSIADAPATTAWTQPSSAAASPSPSQSSNSGGGLLSGLLGRLFPAGKGSADWTTSDGAMSFDDALKPLTAGKLPSQGNAPDGSNALVANYPAGTVKLAAPGHGYSFYSAGDKDGVYVQGAKEVMFSYSVFFESGFDFVKGGKLPGVYGGTSLETAKSCSGGRQDSRDECFSARLMWRTNGMGELYNYYPTAVYGNSGYCSTGPMSKCDTTFGDSIGRGAFTFPTGEWTTVAMRLKLNDANVANGEQELFVNGQSVLKIDSLMISVNAQTKIYGIMAQTFFGGSDASWASPKDQSAWFKDWSMAVLS